MKRAVVVVLAVAVSAAAFGYEEIFEHIDYFITNFPETSQEARNKLASLGYVQVNTINSDFFIQYITKIDNYQVCVWPRVEEDRGRSIGFLFEFPVKESPEFYRIYRSAVLYFNNKYENFFVTIENNAHIYTNENKRFSISFSDTTSLNIWISPIRRRQ
jgi:hypothetical protein